MRQTVASTPNWEKQGMTLNEKISEWLDHRMLKVLTIIVDGEES